MELVPAASLRSKDHIMVQDVEYRVLSSDRSGDMMWMVTGYVLQGPSRNLFVRPDHEFEVVARDAPYSKEFG